MKATDLMIGDYVEITGKGACRVKHINWPSQHKEMDAKMHPIPLTSEILEKNGFERISKSPYKTEFRLCLDEDNDDFLFVEIHHLRDYATVYYNPLNRMVRLDCNIENCMVHELQHALKLCRIDKDIVLNIEN